jgi:hypothetical protein
MTGTGILINKRRRVSEFHVIVLKRDSSWWSALSSVGGVYLVLDTATGKAYVGSAYGTGGIWQRWSAYAETRQLTLAHTILKLFAAPS